MFLKYIFKIDSICLLTDTAILTITVEDSIHIDLVDTVSICTADSLIFNPLISGSANSFIWSSNPLFSDTLNTTTSIPDLILYGPLPGTYYFQASNAYCSKYDSVVIEILGASLDLMAEDSVCAGDLIFGDRKQFKSTN